MVREWLREKGRKRNSIKMDWQQREYIHPSIPIGNCTFECCKIARMPMTIITGSSVYIYVCFSSWCSCSVVNYDWKLINWNTVIMTQIGSSMAEIKQFAGIWARSRWMLLLRQVCFQFRNIGFIVSSDLAYARAIGGFHTPKIEFNRFKGGYVLNIIFFFAQNAEGMWAVMLHTHFASILNNQTFTIFECADIFVLICLCTQHIGVAESKLVDLFFGGV